MTFGKRSVVAVAGLLLGLGAAGAIPATALAAPVPATALATHQTAPGQPTSDAHQQITVSPAASPSTSPSVRTLLCHPGHADCGALSGCPSQFACARVIEGSVEWEFQFFNYGAYHLSNWLNSGSLQNHQTGGAAVRTYNVNGKQIHCYAPRSAAYTVNWDPVWRINLTSSRCG